MNNLITKLEEYKKKYYLNELIKGLFLGIAIVLIAFFILNTLEYFGRFGTSVRTVLFMSFCGVFLYAFFSKIYNPLLYFVNAKKPMDHQELAIQIGKYFPNINDKLLNTLQLSSNNTHSNADLINAAIAQKTKDLSIVKFTDAINTSQNKKYARFAMIPGVLIALVLAIYPPYLVESSKRIVDFKNEYAEPAPFQFQINNKSLKAFKNEDFELSLSLNGTVIPENIFLLLGEKKILLDKNEKNQYKYVFRNIQNDQNFHFEAAGFNSDNRKIEVNTRPNLTKLILQFNYPNYLGKQNNSVENTGNFIVPEGTVVTWSIDTEDTDSLRLDFGADGNVKAKKALVGQSFEYSKQILHNTDYKITLYNEHGSNQNPALYNISTIADQYPSISLEQFKDTTLYNYIVFGGKISDDYGLTALKVHYTISSDGGKNRSSAFSIPIDRQQDIQGFYHSWMLDSLKLQPGEKLNYYVQVWDNDGVHGPKASKSEMLQYNIPNKENLDKAVEASLNDTEKQMDKVMKEAELLKKELAKLEQKLKNNPELSFQEKKQLEELIKKRDDLMSELRQLQQKNQMAMEQQERFQQMKPELADKFNQLDKLIKDMLNDENKKMYENLKNLLEKNENEKMLNELEKLKNKEQNLAKDIDRAMKLFKKLEKEQKIDKAIKDLLEQAEKQDKLADETENLDNDSKKDLEDKDGKKQDEIEKKQDELEKKFEQTKEDLKDAEKLSEELKEEKTFDSDKKSQEEISKEQSDSKKNLGKKDNKSAKESQKKASKKMKNLAEKLQDQKQSAEMEQMEENEDDMRQILENLVKLSFDQEQLMKDFRNIRIGDPRFLKLAQHQVKLKDDAKIVEDSLYALASRVFQIKSFITKELSNMKYYMDGASESIKDRALGATASKQQFAMASMNNLALMLSDALKDMQMSMMEMSGKGKPKKGKKIPIPMLTKMQQELNQKMQGKGKDGKDGKEGKDSKGMGGEGGGAEQMAKLAAEQARIRQMIQAFMESQQGSEFDKKMGDKMKDLLKKMDQTETDIVNKNITPQTMRRQQEIEIRLLESEKALREQEQDEQRKANTAMDIPKSIPKELEQYIKNKQKQTELIRTVPPSLSTFYKKEVDAYFKRINK